MKSGRDLEVKSMVMGMVGRREVRTFLAFCYYGCLHNKSK